MYKRFSHFCQHLTEKAARKSISQFKQEKGRVGKSSENTHIVSFKLQTAFKYRQRVLGRVVRRITFG